MAAMTVLPSFQTFLQSATGARSPPAQSSAAPQTLSPAFYYQEQLLRPLSPLSWADAADRLYAHVGSPSPRSSSSDDDDDMTGRPRARSDGYKRRLSLVGSDACSSPTRVLPSLTRSASADVAPGVAAGKRQKKKYLKERERCEIVRRVRAGEKQAHLAKEFGVSRAAVCYLLKHQMEILRRSAERL
jgi:hypothetical protein